MDFISMLDNFNLMMIPEEKEYERVMVVDQKTYDYCLSIRKEDKYIDKILSLEENKVIKIIIQKEL